MSLEKKLDEQSYAEEPRSFRQLIYLLALQIAHLDPGPAAALRRGPLEGAGVAAFWKLLADYGLGRGSEANIENWAAVVQAIAILTPKGRDHEKVSAHEPKIAMGAAICRAGVSELRLARMLGAPASVRRQLVVRTCRRLARTDYHRFDVITLALFLLAKDSAKADKIARKIAEHYYRVRIRHEHNDE